MRCRGGFFRSRLGPQRTPTKSAIWCGKRVRPLCLQLIGYTPLYCGKECVDWGLCDLIWEMRRSRAGPPFHRPADGGIDISRTPSVFFVSGSHMCSGTNNIYKHVFPFFVRSPSGSSALRETVRAKVFFLRRPSRDSWRWEAQRRCF